MSSKPEQLIEDAIIFAQQKGLKINRGGSVFDRCVDGKKVDYPISCNAIGAILIKLGREDLVNNGFNPQWIKIICAYLEVEPFWINRFILGFDYGAQVTLIRHDCFLGEVKENDKISAFGSKLAKKYVK